MFINPVISHSSLHLCSKLLYENLLHADSAAGMCVDITIDIIALSSSDSLTHQAAVRGPAIDAQNTMITAHHKAEMKFAVTTKQKTRKT